MSGSEPLLLEASAGPPASVPALPHSSFLWVRSDDPDAEVGAPDKGYLREGRGSYQDLAKILFKLNNYRPGPVRGYFIVVKLGADSKFAVGQLRADSVAPVQVFEDLVFPNEEDARLCAARMRGNRPGVYRETVLPNEKESPRGW